MPSSWTNSLSQALNRLRKADPAVLARVGVLGVGSDLRGDDSAGLWVARGLLRDERVARAGHLLVLEGGPAPENCTGALRAFRPDLVLLVDAAHLDEAPGATRLIDLDEIDGMSASSHSLPLSMLASYLTLELGCEVMVLGIQPEQNEVGDELSLSVGDEVDGIVAEIGKILF